MCSRKAPLILDYFLPQEKLKDLGLVPAKANLNTELCLREGGTNLLVLLEYHAVERVSKCDHCIVSDFLFMHNTYHVLGTCFLEDLPNKL